MNMLGSSPVSYVEISQVELTSVWDFSNENIQFSDDRDDDVCTVVQYEGGGQACVSGIYTSSMSSMQNISENNMSGGFGMQSGGGGGVSRIQPR